MKKTLCALALAGMLALGVSGCAMTHQSVKQTLTGSTVAVNAAMEHSIQAYKDGDLTKEEVQKLTPMFEHADDALDAAWTAWLMGRPQNAAEAVATFNAILAQILDITRDNQQEAQGHG